MTLAINISEINYKIVGIIFKISYNINIEALTIYTLA